MNKESLRKSVSSALVVGIIIIFLALIDFHVVLAGMIQKLFGKQLYSGRLPDAGFFLVFLGLIGIWNGWRAARLDQQENKSLFQCIACSAAAGLTTGLVVAVYAVIVGSIDAQGTDLRVYLSLLSSDSIQFFLFQQPVFIGGLIHLGFGTLLAAAGGFMAALYYRNQDQLKERLSSVKSWYQERILNKVQSVPYINYILLGIMVLLLGIMPQVWGSYWNYVMGTVGIYVLLGLGLNIIVGLSGQLVLGYVAFFAIGAYTFALTTAPEPHNLVVNFWVAILASIILAAISGILVGLPILRLRGDYLAIVTLGFGEIIRILLRSDLLKDFTMGPRGVRDIAGPTLFGREFSSSADFMYLIIIAVILSIFFAKRLQESSVGRAWLSISQDETVAQATGVDTYKYKLLALALGASLAGLGGALFASRNQFTGPEDHALMVSINVLCLVIVGGMGSIPGVILGSFALKGLPEILREMENYRMLVFGALLVVMMIILPEGLWPANRPKLEIDVGKESESPQVGAGGES